MSTLDLDGRRVFGPLLKIKRRSKRGPFLKRKRRRGLRRGMG